jgi:glucose-fructose oxidoreductase
VEAQKPNSWWYKKAAGGGSLLDYLGYGATLGTWFLDGEVPIEVTCVVDETPGIEVDQHSITVCRYRRGLSKFETRWGTFSDPWTQQPQPKCGFVLVGTHGTISSYDYDDFVTMQTRKAPALSPVAAGTLPLGRRGPIEYMLARIEDGAPITGPLDPALCLIAQRMGRQRRALGRNETNRAARRMTDAPDLDAYSLKSVAAAEIAAPDLPYRPPMPRDLSHRIALVGAGGISAAHLGA